MSSVLSAPKRPSRPPGSHHHGRASRSGQPPRQTGHRGSPPSPRCLLWPSCLRMHINRISAPGPPTAGSLPPGAYSALGSTIRNAGLAVTPPRCIRQVPCSMNTSTYRRLHNTVSTYRKSTARIPEAWACRNCRQIGPERCRVKAHGVENLPDGGRCHGDAELHQLGLDPAMTPERILARQAQHDPLDTWGCRRTAGPAPPARIVLSRCQPAVPGQECRRRHGEYLGPAPA
jgi:hypothetical protein